MEEKKVLISQIGTQIDGAESYLRALKDKEKDSLNRLNLEIVEDSIATLRHWLEVYNYNLDYDRGA